MDDMDNMRVLAKFFAICLCAVVAGPLLADVRPDRLWLSGSNSSLRPLLTAAAYKALENPDCSEVLYGRLNEYRTEHVGTAFTILCMKDARTTFNLVFYASDLGDVAMPASNPDDNASRVELERLREMLGQPVRVQSSQASQPAEVTAEVTAEVPAEETETAQIAEPANGDGPETASPVEPPEILPPPEIF
jgi:hypothetical protein